MGYLLSSDFKVDNNPDLGGGNVETSAKASNTKAAYASAAQKQDLKEYFKIIDIAMDIGLVRNLISA